MNNFSAPGLALCLENIMAIKLDMLMVLTKFLITGEKITQAVSNVTM